MNVLIVEDEGLLARRLKNMLQEMDSSIVITGMTGSINSTIEWLKENEKPDLIFMDIELADGRCFDIFNAVPIATPVIFTTAYDEFALQAFKVNSVDYLLKPVKKAELKQALDKFKTYYQLQENSIVQNLQQLIHEMTVPADKKQYRNRFLVKSGQKMISVETGEAGYFTIQNTINFLITKEKQKFIIEYSLDELEQMLDPEYFFRVNRQFIIAHDIITAVHPWFGSKLKVDISLPSEENIIVSRQKANLFKEWMGA
ncbi:MAG: LytTR family DNA-binding domain-containing protein [Bacteroidota bacterium]